MTREQREILKGYIDNDGKSFPVHTIEYPSIIPGYPKNACLKIVSSVKTTHVLGNEEWTKYVDWFDEDGRTIRTERL